MNYKNVVVAGGGILGSQIAFQSAYCGFNVTILVREEDSKEEVKEKLVKLKKNYIDAIKNMSKAEPIEWCRGISSADSFDKNECINFITI